MSNYRHLREMLYYCYLKPKPEPRVPARPNFSTIIIIHAQHDHPSQRNKVRQPVYLPKPKKSPTKENNKRRRANHGVDLMPCCQLENLILSSSLLPALRLTHPSLTWTRALAPS